MRESERRGEFGYIYDVSQASRYLVLEKGLNSLGQTLEEKRRSIDCLIFSILN
jgi:uncharacterized protein YlbG (UPF0298 family)